MKSDATTVEAYLAELPEDRRDSIAAVRRTILEHLPPGFEEVMNWGMISYQVPRADYADTYNGQPLLYAALATQKNHMAVYLSGIYSDEAARERFERAYRATGKRFDVGRSCVRFRKLDDLPLEVIGDAIGRMSVADFISVYETARSAARKVPRKGR
jgi:hypothetical protein